MRYPSYLLRILGIFLMALVLCVPSVSSAVNRLDHIQQNNGVDDYIDDPILDESEMELLEKHAIEMAKIRADIKMSSDFAGDNAASGKEPENGAFNPILLALNESHKTTAETSDKTPAGAADDFEESDQEIVADPFEPVNRVIFDFNDKVYFGVMKPFYGVYNSTLPEEVRTAGRNVFDNAAMPVRFVSCALQIKPECAGIELARFCINTIIGMVGIFDIAANDPFSLKPQDADVGLALAHYGIGDGFYIVLPFMGPSSLRDTAGMAGDSFLTPTSYINPFYVPLAISAGNYLNRGSLVYTEYEDLKKSAIDPYVAFKDAYIQYRRGKIKK